MSRIAKVYRNRNYVGPGYCVPPVPKSDLEPFCLENVQELLALRLSGPIAAFARFLKAGRHSIFLLVDGVRVGHAWVTRPVDHEHIVNNFARLKAGESLNHCCYVDPDYRGLGYYSEMLHAVTLWTLRQGATQVRVDTGADNVPSQRGTLRAGFEETAPTTSIVVGRWLFWTNRR